MSHTFEELPKKIQVILRLPIITAIVSFVIGTVIFALYYIQKDSSAILIDGELRRPGEYLIYVGAGYLFIAFIINALLILLLAACSFIYREYRFTILKYAMVLLLNIPIAALYFYLLFMI